jgi:hypothetical protein
MRDLVRRQRVTQMHPHAFDNGNEVRVLLLGHNLHDNRL